MPHFPSPEPSRVTAPALARAALGAAALVLAATACNDPLRIEAQLEVAADTLVASALSGTGPNAASALLLRREPGVAAPERVTASDFDLVVDINAAGQPVLYPATLVAQLAPRRVGIRRVDQRYDSLGRAPGGDYVTDSALTVRVGETVSVQVPALGSECLYAARPYFYSKVVVDSVRLTGRLVFLRATTNPNCGFRSFAPGVPKD
jgi:hypothetical protein